MTSKYTKCFLKYFLLIGVMCFGSPALSDNAGLQIAASADLVGGFGLGSNSGGPSQFDVIRETEVMIYSPADHLFEGRVSLAAHPEGGAVMFELHEAILSSTKLIPGWRFRVGQFFLPIGRLNRVHRHDWSFISPPKVQSDFFADEGILDRGIEFGTLLPVPFYLDLVFGVTAGRVFGHAHTGGQVPRVPTHYVRMITFGDFGSGSGIQVAGNYLGRVAKDGTKMTIIGLDTVAKWRENKRLVWLIENEIWYRVLSTSVSTSKEIGGYIYPQYGITDSLYVGVRGDILSDTSSGMFDHNLVPTITFKPSEFTTFRAAYNLRGTRQHGMQLNTDNFFELQAVFIIGAHPAHSF